jgi:hypothetical protein
MGRQPFRKMRSDGTMEETGSASGGSSRTTLLAGQIDAFGKGRTSTNLTRMITLTTANHSSQGLTSSITFNSNKYEGAFGYPFQSTMAGTVNQCTVYINRAESVVESPEIRVGIYDTDEISDGRIQVTDLLGYWDIPVDSTGFVTVTSLTSGSISLTLGKMYFVAYVQKYDYGGSSTTCVQLRGNSNDFNRQIIHGINTNAVKQVYLNDSSLDHTLPSTWANSYNYDATMSFYNRPYFQLLA